MLIIVFHHFSIKMNIYDSYYMTMAHNWGSAFMLRIVKGALPNLPMFQTPQKPRPGHQLRLGQGL